MPALYPRCEYNERLLNAALQLTITYYLYAVMTFLPYSCVDTSLNGWNLVESLRTEVFRAHLGHCKDTQNNKHCKEMLGIYHFDEQIWFIPQPFRVKTDLRGIIPSLLLNSLLHSTSIFVHYTGFRHLMIDFGLRWKNACFILAQQYRNHTIKTP